jgi:hypothetical protein
MTRIQADQMTEEEHIAKCFGNITTILYISCCFDKIEDIRYHFNNRDMGHTSSVVRASAHEMVDYFQNAVNVNMSRFDTTNGIINIITNIPKVGMSNEYIPNNVAMYIKPYIINQLFSICNGKSDMIVENTDLE